MSGMFIKAQYNTYEPLARQQALRFYFVSLRETKDVTINKVSYFVCPVRY